MKQKKVPSEEQPRFIKILKQSTLLINIRINNYMSTASIIIRSIASQVLLSYTRDDRGLSDVIGKISSWPAARGTDPEKQGGGQGGRQ